MAYKDEDKRKQSQRERTRRYRDKQKGVTSEGVTHEAGQGVTLLPIMTVTPEGPKPKVPNNYGLENCECKHCQTELVKKGMVTPNHGAAKTVNQLASREFNRVSLPGDVDYLHHDTIENCVECGKELPKLSRPRTRPGKCYPCVMRKQATEKPLHDVEAEQAAMREQYFA